MLVELSSLKLSEIHLKTKGDLSEPFSDDVAMQFVNINYGRSTLEVRVRGKVTSPPETDEYDRVTFALRPSVEDIGRIIILENVVNESSESSRLIKELGFETKDAIEERFGETYTLLRENQLKIKLRPNTKDSSKWSFLCNRTAFTPESSDMEHGETVTVALSLGMYFNEKEGKSGWYTVLKDLSFDGSGDEDESVSATPPAKKAKIVKKKVVVSK